MLFDDVLVQVMYKQLTYCFQVFTIVSMDSVSSEFEEWIHVFCARFIWSKERNFTGRDHYTRRAYLEYVISLAIM